MNDTIFPSENLTILLKISSDVTLHFENKYQDALIRFVYCGIEKLQKVSQALNILYPKIEESPDLEFPLGILIRSMMMDCLMVQKIKHSIFLSVENDPSLTRPLLRKVVVNLCYKFLNDGTNSLINEVYNSSKIETERKDEIAKKFAKRFQDAFELGNGKPKQHAGFRVVLADLYQTSAHEALVFRESIYNLYTFYSKYDHLSHWTSLPKVLPLEHRKGKIDLGIILILLQLRDLLALAFDFDESYSMLEQPLMDLQRHIDSQQLREQRVKC